MHCDDSHFEKLSAAAVAFVLVTLPWQINAQYDGTVIRCKMLSDIAHTHHLTEQDCASWQSAVCVCTSGL